MILCSCISKVSNLDTDMETHNVPASIICIEIDWLR